jgi:alkylhydroperoxidase family enzyme
MCFVIGTVRHPDSDSRRSYCHSWSDLKQGNYVRFSEKERAALIYAEKLTRSPHNVTDQDFLDLKKHFPDEQVVDLHLLTGLANLTNRFTDPLGLELEFPEQEI